MLGHEDQRRARLSLQGSLSHEAQTNSVIRLVPQSGKMTLSISTSEVKPLELTADVVAQLLEYSQNLNPEAPSQEYDYVEESFTYHRKPVMPSLPSDPMIPSSSVGHSPASSPFSRSLLSSHHSGWYEASPRQLGASPLAKGAIFVEEEHVLFPTSTTRNFLEILSPDASPVKDDVPLEQASPTKSALKQSPKQLPRTDSPLKSPTTIISSELTSPTELVEPKTPRTLSKTRSTMGTPGSRGSRTSITTPRAPRYPPEPFSCRKTPSTKRASKQPLSHPFVGKSPETLKQDSDFVNLTMIFGKNTSTTPKPLNEYQRKINEASLHLASKNPLLLDLRKDLFELAKKKLLDDGYRYARGSSRSKYDPEVAKRIQTWEENRQSFPELPSSPRCDEERTIGLTAEQRKQRIAQLEEALKDKNTDIADYEAQVRKPRRKSKVQEPDEETKGEIGALLVELKRERDAIKVELSRLKSKERKYQTLKRQRIKREPESDDEYASRPPLI